jgi:hypothetical protein
MASPVHPYSDYGVALRTLKAARGWLGYLMLACVIVQFVGFGLMYGTQQPYERLKAEYTKTNADVLKERMLPVLEAWGVVPPGSKDRAQDWFPRTAQSRQLNIRTQWDATYTMAVPVTQALGLMAATSQTIIVFLTLLVILMAHAPGVAQVTRSLIWTVLLAFMVFPWQSVFTQGFPIPGIFWGYQEMTAFIGPHVVAGEQIYGYQRFLVVARFILWPLLALLVLLITSERFRSGIMLAIGHPLQSMMQAPGGGGAGAKAPAGSTSGTPMAGTGSGYGAAAKR